MAPLAAGQPLLNVDLTYVDALTGAHGSSTLAVPQPEGEPPEKLGQAMALVDEYVSLTQALDQYHLQNDRKATFATLDQLAQRLDAVHDDGFAGEVSLVGGLRDKMAHLAGYRGEIPPEMKPGLLEGRWKVTYFKGVDDIERGDLIRIGDGSFVTYPGGDESSNDQIWQSYEVNSRQLYIADGDLLFQYRRIGDRLVLRTKDGRSEIAMKIQ